MVINLKTTVVSVLLSQTHTRCSHTDGEGGTNKIKVKGKKKDNEKGEDKVKDMVKGEGNGDREGEGKTCRVQEVFQAQEIHGHG